MFYLSGYGKDSCATVSTVWYNKVTVSTGLTVLTVSTVCATVSTVLTLVAILLDT